MPTVNIGDHTKIHSSKEEIYHVDATPGRDYPLRILRAHLSDCRVECTVPGVAEAMNKATDERNRWLMEAIAILEKELKWELYT